MADSVFIKALDGYRTIIPQVGESLQELALRELGDAAQWPLIAWVNGLKTPYLVADPTQVRDGVVLAGTPLLVPDAKPEPSPNGSDLYYTDVLLTRGLLTTVDGDISLVSGKANLGQGLRHRLVVDKRELLFHPKYGCHITRLLGRSSTPQTCRLAEFYVRSSLLEDERVMRVDSCVAEAVGDSMRVVASVTAISGVTVGFEVNL